LNVRDKTKETSVLDKIEHFPWGVLVFNHF